MIRVLLFGRNGQVGGELERLLGADHALTALDRAGCDLADPQSIRAAIARVRPQVIVNAAAWTAVDRAEAEPEACQRINADAPATMAEAARGHDALLVHYSTDYVFDGRKRRPYVETDPTAPLGVYGRSKLDGERAIAASGCAHLILRTSWVYGMTGHNFLRTMLRLGAERDELAIVDDQVGSPTWSRSIARATRSLIARHGRDPSSWTDISGLYHATAGGSTSWFGFAGAIFELADGLAKRPRLRPITTAEYPLPAPRPAWSVLDCSRLRSALGVTLPDWRDALVECLGGTNGPGSSPPTPAPGV
jgi:dTDP-4-dehydrorhamnose reductase